VIDRMQKAMELARLAYEHTENFLTLRHLDCACKFADRRWRGKPHCRAHGRLNDVEMRKGLGSGRAALNELETQIELPRVLPSFNPASPRRCLTFIGSWEVDQWLIGVLDPAR